MDPPDEYYLNVVRQEQRDTVLRTYILEYNDMGLVSNGTMEYDSSENLVRSNWGGRPYFVNYEYSGDLLIAVISEGHPLHRYEYYFQYYSNGQLKEINHKFFVSDELDSESSFQLEYQDNNLVVKQIPKDTRLDTIITIYELDNGHSPYPYEERLRLGSWPFEVPKYATERNIVSVRTEDQDTGMIEVIRTFTYDYNGYGYPVKTESSDSDVVHYFEYSDQP